MKETTITIKHAVAAARRQKWQQRNTNVNLNFFHDCRSDRSAPSLSLPLTHTCDDALSAKRREGVMCVYVRVRACVHVCVLCSVAMLKMDIVVKCFFDFVSTVDTTKTK